MDLSETDLRKLAGTQVNERYINSVGQKRLQTGLCKVESNCQKAPLKIEIKADTGFGIECMTKRRKDR